MSDAGKLDAGKLDAGKMFKVAMWMIENHKPMPPQEPYLVLHPKEIERIEKKYGSIDRWWKHVSSGQIWKEILDE